MKKHLPVALATTALLLGLSTAPVYANHCPADVKAIDHALSKSSLGAEQMAKVKALRDEGEALHNAGSHKESTDKLAEAMRMILNGM